MLRTFQLLCCLVLLVACGRAEDPIHPDEVEGPVSWGSASKVTHLRHLWLSDQPDEAGLEIARNEGVGVVINLREASEFDWDEQSAVEALGMDYYHVAVPGDEPFSEEAFTRIDELVESHLADQVLIHCSSGNRVAGWLATHLVRNHGMQFADALVVARKAGITKEVIAEKAAAFLGQPASSERAMSELEAPDAAALQEQARGLFGVLPAEASSEVNPVTDAKVDLGRVLYYDERLSRNHDVSCNSCHPLAEFGADGEPTSPGHRGARGDRNSPTVYNAAFHLAQFWDGRAVDVEEQARGPIQNPVEMALPDGETAERVIRSIPGYEPLFREAFPQDAADPVTFDNAVDAIGAFERRLTTPSRFDDFISGNAAALTVVEQRGLATFIESGCTACHSGRLLGGHMYQKIGLVHPYETEDVGRYAVTKNESDRYTFKVPSLRNIVETGPYLHDGSVASIQEVVRLMAWHQIGRELGQDQIESIVAFLGSLTGQIDTEFIARPAIPASGPDTPAPDSSDPFARAPRFSSPIARPAGAGDVSEREVVELIDTRCKSCHRFEGKAESKFRISAPDLMWGGQKYQRAWLVRWLQGEEPSMYPGAYRWDQRGEVPLHPTVVAEEAEAIADYFEKHLTETRIREGVFDPTDLTELEIRRGGELFREYSCIGCHQVLENGKPVGGPISTTFFDSKRYDPDWVMAFNLDPPSFTPHSGEYVADVSERKVGWLTGYIMVQGIPDFAFATPWKEGAFTRADAKRGDVVYQEYCSQCHGFSGEGDGPGAAGLDPAPAAHARMAIDQLPDDYLYNVIHFGGKSVGKSALMPDWGMTLTPQQIADVMASMRARFKTAAVAATAGDCPQPRATVAAPAEFLSRENPLEPTTEHLEAGRKLYHESAVPMACQFCHGPKGDGLGALAGGFTPPPRIFTCAETMDSLSDGQLFWIVRNGSPKTGMMGFPGLTEEQTWQVILYVRSFAQ